MRDKPDIPGRGLVYGVLLSIPLWGLIVAAIFSVLIRMILLALAVVLLASKLPPSWWLLSNTMLLGALALVIYGVVSAIDRWF
jgi:hypothetical protein